MSHRSGVDEFGGWLSSEVAVVESGAMIRKKDFRTELPGVLRTGCVFSRAQRPEELICSACVRDVKDDPVTSLRVVENEVGRRAGLVPFRVKVVGIDVSNAL